MVSRTWKRLMMKNLELLMEFEQCDHYREVYEEMHERTKKQLKEE